VEEIIEPENKTAESEKIGEEITEILEYTPGKLFVRRIVRPKYRTGKEISVGELPSLPLPKSNAGASLLSHIMVSKFIDHLPFYRQIQIFKRQKVVLSSSTISGWFNQTAELLEPLYDVLEQEVLNTDYLQMDESPIGVQDSHKSGALHQGYQWVYRNPVKGLVLFKYNSSRSKKVPEEILSNYSGYLQTDGYAAYKNLVTKGDITLLGCMAHARRYFEKALDNDHKRASYAIKLIQELYAIERKCKERSVDGNTKQRYRERYTAPVLIQMKQWLDDNLNQVLPKSSIGKAIAYTIKIWKNLERYVLDPRFEIDNNLIENSIRPLALGRKNYLFAGSH
jgi:transposase